MTYKQLLADDDLVFNLSSVTRGLSIPDIIRFVLAVRRNKNIVAAAHKRRQGFK